MHQLFAHAAMLASPSTPASPSSHTPSANPSTLPRATETDRYIRDSRLSHSRSRYEWYKREHTLRSPQRNPLPFELRDRPSAVRTPDRVVVQEGFAGEPVYPDTGDSPWSSPPPSPAPAPAQKTRTKIAHEQYSAPFQPGYGGLGTNGVTVADEIRMSELLTQIDDMEKKRKERVWAGKRRPVVLVRPGEAEEAIASDSDSEDEDEDDGGEDEVEEEEGSDESLRPSEGVRAVSPSAVAVDEEAGRDGGEVADAEAWSAGRCLALALAWL